MLLIVMMLVASCLSPTSQPSNPTFSPSQSLAPPPSVSPSPISTVTSTATLQPTNTSTPEASRTPTATPTRTVNTHTPAPTPTVKPTVGPIGQVQLGVYELVMAYKTNRWQENESDELGHKVLSHTIFPNCRIQEYGPGHILGDFQFRLGLGQHLFSMYEYFEEREGEATLRREYVIEGQAPTEGRTPGPTPMAKPAFIVTAPVTNTDDCIVSVHVVLATLKEPPDQ